MILSCTHTRAPRSCTHELQVQLQPDTDCTGILSDEFEPAWANKSAQDPWNWLLAAAAGVRCSASFDQALVHQVSFNETFVVITSIAIYGARAGYGWIRSPAPKNAGRLTWACMTGSVHNSFTVIFKCMEQLGKRVSKNRLASGVYTS